MDLAAIQKNFDLIAKILSSIFQILLIIIVISFLAVLAEFIFSDQEGITILPFDTSGMGQDCSGKAVADRLGMEMQKIRGIHEYKLKLINSGKNAEQIDFPSIASKAQTMDESLSKIGNVDVGPASVSLGQLLLIMRSIAGSSDNSITGSLETYGANISIVALMENKSSNKGTLAWEMTLPIESDNLSNKDMVPSLIKDMSYNIFYNIQRDSGAVASPKSWISFKYLTEGWNAYRTYNITGNTGHLERAEEMMRKGLDEDPYSIEFAQLMVVLQSAYQSSGDSEKSDALVEMATHIPLLSGEAWFNKGVSFSNEGRWKDSADAFDNAIMVNPENKLYWVSKSYALNKLTGTKEAKKEALQAAEEAIKLDQNYADAWHEKGNALYNLGDFENSSEAHEKSIELDSSKWWYYFDHALPLGAMGVEEDCDKCYAEAIENLNAALGFDLSDSDRKDIIALKEGILAESQFSRY